MVARRIKSFIVRALMVKLSTHIIKIFDLNGRTSS